MNRIDEEAKLSSSKCVCETTFRHLTATPIKALTGNNYCKEKYSGWIFIFIINQVQSVDENTTLSSKDEYDKQSAAIFLSEVLLRLRNI